MDIPVVYPRKSCCKTLVAKRVLNQPGASRRSVTEPDFSPVERSACWRPGCQWPQCELLGAERPSMVRQSEKISESSLPHGLCKLSVHSRLPAFSGFAQVFNHIGV